MVVPRVNRLALYHYFEFKYNKTSFKKYMGDMSIKFIKKGFNSSERCWENHL